MDTPSGNSRLESLTAKLVSTALSLERLSDICKMLQPIVEGFEARLGLLWEIAPNAPVKESLPKEGTEASESLFLRAQWPLGDKIPCRLRLPLNSVTSEVARKQVRRNIDDISDDPAIYQAAFLEELKLQTMCSVPVKFRDGNVGVLNVFRDIPKPLNEQEQSELEALARLFPPLYQTVRHEAAFNLLQRTNAILYDAEYKNGSSVPSSNKVRQTLKRICHEVSETLRCLETSIFLGDRLEKLENGDTVSGPVSIDLMATTFPEVESFQRLSYHKGDQGQTAWVFTHGESLHIFDLEDAEQETAAMRNRDPNFAVLKNPAMLNAFYQYFRFADDREAPPFSFIATPIISGGRVLGVLRCRGSLVPPYQLAERELHLLELVAEQIGLYWSNWLSRQELDRENHSLRQLVSGVNTLNRAVYVQLTTNQLDLALLYNQTLEIVSRVIARETVSDIRLFDEEKKELYFAHFRGYEWDRGSEDEIKERRSRRFPLEWARDRSVGAYVFHTRQVREVPDVRNDRAYSPTFPEARHVIVAPIHIGDKFYGVLDVHGMEEHSFHKHIHSIIELLGLQLGLYSYLAENMERLRKTQKNLDVVAKTNMQIFEDMKHQLRSPLIQANARLSSIGMDTLEEPSLRMTLQAIRGLVRKTQRVAFNMSLFESLESEKSLEVKKSPLRYDDLIKLLVEAAADQERTVTPSSGIQFFVERHGFSILQVLNVQVDRELLEQAVRNIFDNAAKYSYEQTTVRIYGGVTGTGRFHLSVLNKGIPIEPDQVKSCIERGWRGEIAAATTGEGSGIGLWIVENIMQAHGGDLVISPQRGNLTEVRLIFPAKRN